MLPSWMRSNALHDMDLALRLLINARNMCPAEALLLQEAAELVAGALARTNITHLDAIAQAERNLAELEEKYGCTR